MDQKLKNYSSGMQVRLAFSMATRSKADVLLIDEVLAVGDADFQRKCFQYFRRLKKERTTVVFISHDMEAVREYCDRCIMIDDSKLILEGDPEKVAERYIQLFNDATSIQEQEQNEERWGDGAARAQNVQAILNNTELSISADITFNSAMREPIIGFLVKNSSGMTLCGTNSKVLRKKLGTFKPGDVMRVRYVLPNIFGDDVYGVEIAVTHNDGVTQADWWHNATSFISRNQETTPHPVSPRIQLQTEQA